MANKDMERLVISGLDEHNYILVPDTTLTKDGVPADAGAVGDALEEVSEDIEGVQEDLSSISTEGTVPTSEQMLSDNYTEDSVPYHFRKTASDNADREELEIVGGSVAWNQVLPNGNFANGYSSWTLARMSCSVSNNVATITIDNTNDPYIQNAISATSFADHVLMATSEVKATQGNWIMRAFYNNDALTASSPIVENANAFTNLAIMFKPSMNTGYVRFRIVSAYATIAVGNSADVKNCMLFDLTQMFGSTIADHIYSLEQATAGAGVALFRSLFPKDYYAYDAGSMQSVSGLSEHRTVGFNVWDEVTEKGYYGADGAPVAANDYLRSKNYIPVLPSTSYYVKNSGTGNVLVCEYDADKNYISNSRINRANLYWTTSDKTRYLRFNLQTTYGTTYNRDICINLSDPAKNGTYEPYDGHSYALDDSLTLRGIPTLVDGKIKWDGDVYAPSGTVTRRYRLVTMSDVISISVGTTSANVAYADVKFAQNSQSALAANNSVFCLATHYTSVDRNTTGAEGLIKTYQYTVTVYDARFTSVDNARSVLTTMGFAFVYQLATPTTEQADPYISPQICHYDGTEEFVSTGIVPVGHNTKYPDNLRMKLDNLPWNFATLIAPVESGFKATRNYTTGALLIVNNVLYKATANIANGGTITPNTNVTATTLAEVISALS